jgi:hypothetical protein
MKYALIPIALGFWVLTAAHAADAPTPPPTLVACNQLADSSERLKCYDAQMAAMLAAAKPAAASPAAASPPPAIATAPTAPAAAEAAPTAEQKFGADDLPRTTRDKVIKPDDSLESTIASIRQVRPMIWIISLANGQVWRQEGTQITVFFRAGYDVRIDKGMMNDYRMSTAQTGPKNWVHVTRVQ